MLCIDLTIATFEKIKILAYCEKIGTLTITDIIAYGPGDF
jgi:hypothetical protein